VVEDSTVFVGIDAAKLKHAVAVAEPGRNGEVRYIGEIEASPEVVRKLLAQLAARHGKLHVCYKAGQGAAPDPEWTCRLLRNRKWRVSLCAAVVRCGGRAPLSWQQMSTDRP
jgi:hypothetical protein